MKLCKKTISLMLSVILCASIALSVPFNTLAATEYLWGCALHNADTTDNNWKTSIWNSYSSQSSSTVGGANYSNTQKLSAMKSGGYLNKTNSPYVAWMVNAPEDGTYQIKPVYEVGSTSNSSFSAYNLIVSVNDSAYYNGKTISYTGSTQWIDDDVITISLKKGVNVIRLLTAAADSYPTNVWINVNCLYLQNNCSFLQCYGNELTLGAGNATYIKNWPASNGTLCNVSNGNTTLRNQAITFDTVALNTLSNIPYFSYTVDAPADGYYDVSMLYNIGGTTYANNATGYFIVRVGGNYYKRSFMNTKDGYNTANISVPLKKGSNVVLVSCAMEVSTYQDDFYKGYPNWCDISNVTFYGGVTKSSTQIDPLTLADEASASATVLDAGTYGVLNRYKVSTTETGIKTNKPLVGGMDATTSYIQTLASMQTDGYLDKSQIPYVTYMVNAAEKGTYTLNVVYKPYMNTGYSKENYYMVVSVNDSQYHKAYYNAYTGNANWSDSQVTVELEAGINTIRCMSYVGENYQSLSWLNHDCIYIKGNSRVVGVSPKTTHLQSADSSYINGFTKGSDNTSASEWYVRQLNDYRGRSISGSAGLTFDNLNYKSMQYLCYFSYTVDVPLDGYYDMSTYLSTGSKGATGYIITVIDGEKHKYPVRDCNDSLKYNRANISAYLTKGTHTIAISGIFDHSTYMSSNDGYTDWCNMGALTISGGIAKAATQVNPQSIKSDAEAKGYGLITGSAYTADASHNVTGVSSETSVYMFKNNFKNPASVTVKRNGVALSDTDFVTVGTVAEYSDATYTVASVFGDLNGDGEFDVRDLKAVKEYVFGNTTEIITTAADFSGDGRVTDADSAKITENILGTSNEIRYQAITLGAPTLMDYANPVGRLVIKDNGVMMESSASNFTVSGYMSGNVTTTLFVNKIQGDEIGIFVEVDGDTANPTYIKLSAGVDLTLTLASKLTAGYHTIKVSKSTDAKNDDIYVYGVTVNGTPTVTAAAAHRLEFIGDSITAGYAAKYPKTTSYYTYANYTADALGADYYSVANGGWRFGSGSACLTDIYTKVSMQENLGDYDFSYKPEVIVINVGTNDGSTPSATDQKRMLTTVRAKNPNAKIVWAYGMINHTALDQIKKVVDDFAKTDGNTYFVTLPQYNDGTDNWHTGPQGHAAAAEVLSSYIANLMGWELK